jgi:hypothetical protein
VGAALGDLGVAGALADPILTLFNSSGATVASNDTWGDNANATDIRSAASATGAFALGERSRDAALLITLDPGAYTAQVTGAGGSSGVSLLEVYELP